MVFRNLFFKSAERDPSDRAAEAGEKVSAADFSTSAVTAAEEPNDDGPIHLPHRGLAPFRPQVDRSDGPLHIPYRGLAPFKPAPVERTLADSLVDNSPSVVRELESRPVPKVEVDPAAGVVSGKAVPVVKSTARQTAPVSEEVRERPRESRRSAKPRIPRHSSGWAAMLKHLKQEPNLRVLDIGPTSPNNINFLTGMGHSVYMSDVVQEALEGDWSGVVEDDAVKAFCEESFNFHDRRFDVVLLWTAIDYLPEHFIPAVISRLHESMDAGGQLLAFFHSRTSGADTTYCRYHLVDSTEIDTQENEPYPVLRVYTNREIERLFKDFSGCKFFLARDNVYEVILTR